MTRVLRAWAVGTFAVGLLLKAVPGVYATPLGALYSPWLAAEAGGWIARNPAPAAVTPTGWWVVAAALTLSAALVLRGVRHLRA